MKELEELKQLVPFLNEDAEVVSSTNTDNIEDRLILRVGDDSADVSLNSSSELIWSMCSGSLSVHDIVDTVCASYGDVAPERLAQDVLGSLATLESYSLVCFKDGGANKVLETVLNKVNRVVSELDLKEAGIIATPVGANHLGKKLTIAMATYDDYDGVYFSIQSLRMYHQDVLDDIELIIIDNNPLGACGTALRELSTHIPNLRYIPESFKTGTSIRDLAFEAASSDVVACMDCHVLLEPGSIAKLIRYFEDDAASGDLVQGPLLNDNLSTISTHFSEQWGSGMYGTWSSDPRGLDVDDLPFEIPMQGLGFFACRKKAWPGFNPLFRGFGGEEGYIHEKFRQAGGRVMCLPFLRWLHRFNRPLGVPYPINWEDRIRNYYIGFSELGLDTSPLKEHFAKHISDEFVEKTMGCYKEEFGQEP